MSQPSEKSSARSSFHDGDSSSIPGTGPAGGYGQDLPPNYGQFHWPRSASLNAASIAGFEDEKRSPVGTLSRKGSRTDTSLDLPESEHAGRAGTGIPRSPSLSHVIPAPQASTAWAGRIDPNRLMRIQPDERKRQEAIYELIATEQSYVRDIELICQNFYVPMAAMMSPNDLATIFSNIEDIRLVNAVILSDLETLQLKQDFVIERIGEIFCKHAESLSVYQTYCGNFAGALKLLQRLRTENPKIAEYLKRQQSHNRDCRSLDLSSFLLQPMQRITRYALLLKQVLHYTSKTHPDHEDVVRALDLAEKSAEMVNSAARERESLEKLEEVSRILDLACDEHRLDLRAPTRVLGPRIFILEGPLIKSKSGRKLHGYLFNDVLLLAQPKSKQDRGIRGYQYGMYRKPMPLNEIATRDLPKLQGRDHGSVDEACFQVIHGQDAVTLRAPSVAAKRKWVNALEEQSRQYYLAEKQQSEGSWKDGRWTYGAPIGTLQVLVAEGKNLVRVDRGKLDLFCRVQLNRQQVKTRTVHSPAPRWNQALVLSVLSLDETLKISIYNYDRYSQDDYLGQAEVALDFLEYYGEKETEPITLGLRDVSSGSVVIRLAYRKA
ncbi:Dbl homology domain-containing protein [Phlyctochytrium arcticum]|nr:Dbl homology domain-containing protein [Phlyctochytrium arcticum]